MAQIFLHVGLMKTGTTAMQDWFAAHRPALRQAGLQYLITGRQGRSASNNLADALLHPPPNMPQWLAAIAQEIAQEAAPKVLISAEAISYYGLPILAPLLEALSGHQITLLIWLRRQDRYAEALYKQQIKFAGHKLDPAHFFTPALIERLDYHAMLAAFARLQPQVALAPQIYDEADSGVIPDSIAAMLTALGLAEMIPADSAQKRSNLTPHAEMIALYNSLPQNAGGALRRANRQLMREFGTAAMGKDDVIPLAFATSVMTGLAAANAALQQQYFPDRPSLFRPSPVKTATAPLDPAILDRFRSLFGQDPKG